MKWILIVATFSILILFISSSSSSSSTARSESSSVSTVNSDDYPDEDIESEQTEENIDTTNGLEFNGDPCTEDCSGHEAGYEWAEEKGITQDDVDDYSGNSESFREGMQSYVDENE